MNARRLENVGNNSSTPLLQKEAGVEAGSGNETVSTNPPGENADQISPQAKFTYKAYLEVAAAVDIGTENTIFLRNLINAEAKKIQDSGKNKEAVYRELFYPDDDLSPVVKTKLVPKFLVPGDEFPDADLTYMLRKKLSLTDDMSESAAIVKVLVSNYGLDNFLALFVMPYLRRDEGLEKGDSNYDFCVRLLQSQDDFMKKVVLDSLDYSSVTRFDEFAWTLLCIDEPNQVLNVLLNNSEKITEKNKISQVVLSEGSGVLLDPPSSTQLDLSQVPLMIAIEFLYKAELVVDLKFPNRHSFIVPSVEVDKIERLYKLIASPHKLRDASEFLINNSKKSPEIFKETFLDKNIEEEPSLNRIRRLYAIAYYVWANKKYSSVQDSIPVLKEFMEKEKEPYLVTNCCYMLSKYCGEEGRNTLAKIIINQIKNDEPSMALAGLTMLLITFNKDEIYLDVLKKVLSVEYADSANLGRAYENLLGVELQEIPKDEKGWTYELPRERPDLALTMVEELGLGTLLKLPLNKKEVGTESDKIKNIQMCNLEDLLRWISDQNFHRLRNIVSEELYINNDDQQVAELLSELSNSINHGFLVK